VRVYTPAAAREAWPLLGAESDKYDRGVVGIAAGSDTYPGAAVLAVSGALAGSAGMVRYVGSAASQVLAAHPEVVATNRLSDAGRVQAWVVGSGLGTDNAAREAVDAALDRRFPTVIDADGLTTLAQLIVKDGPAAVRRRPLFAGEPTAVLTPHRRELGRLLDACAGSLADRDPDDPLATARALSGLLNVTLLVKGSHTLIATPGHTAYVNVTATPALATAGTGDVLAGLLGSLLAGGMAPHEAAASAAYLHGAAGVRAEREATVTATRVAAALPEVVAETVYDRRPIPVARPLRCPMNQRGRMRT
ncbi:MAG: NAD(P)H-hydrate dehydratase, partial [Mycobacteriales bacterium]